MATAWMRAADVVDGCRRVWWVSALAVLAAACGSATDTTTGGATTGLWEQAAAGDTTSGGTTTGGTSKDVSGGGGFVGGSDATSAADASGGTSGGTPGGGVAPGDSGGIGLKPGGAQDIGYFRLLLKSMQMPKPGDMTIEGWLNEHDTVLPPAQKDRLVTLHGLGAIVQAPGTPAEAVLQLGLNSGTTLADVATTLALTLVIDNSGSMDGDKLVAVRAGLHTLVDKLPKGTRLAVFSFSDDVKSVWPGQVVTPAVLPQLHQAIDSIWADSGTNIYAGLSAGIADCEGVSAEAFAQKRVMFLSDGQATVGNTNAQAIEALAAPAAAAGCTISTVGVGLNFDAPLMTHVAQKGGGTGWFLQDAADAQKVFVQDLETMLVAVAQNLWIQFKPAPGWKVLDIYGFEWVESTDGVVKITGPKQPPTDPGVDPGQPQTPTTDPGTEPVAMPTLYASSRNGLVLARLAPPPGLNAADILDLALTTVTYGYTASKSTEKAQFDVPVLVPGLMQIPDGGLAYFANPGVRRAWILLQDGLSLMAAVQLKSEGKVDMALAVLDAATVRHDAHVQQMTADLPVYDASAPDLADARALIQQLHALVGP